MCVFLRLLHESLTLCTLPYVLWLVFERSACNPKTSICMHDSVCAFINPWTCVWEVCLHFLRLLHVSLILCALWFLLWLVPEISACICEPSTWMPDTVNAFISSWTCSWNLCMQSSDVYTYPWYHASFHYLLHLFLRALHVILRLLHISLMPCFVWLDLGLVLKTSPCMPETSTYTPDTVCAFIGPWTCSWEVYLHF